MAKEKARKERLTIYRGKRSYTKHTTNTVKDKLTGLIWTKRDDGRKRTMQQAKQYCQALSLDGFSDWRLPTIKKLLYLADRSKYGPSIDKTYFSVKHAWYWSSSEDKSMAWVVNFEFGNSFFLVL